MAPELLPEIYRQIIDIATEPLSQPEKASHHVIRRKTLAKLSLISPVFRELCGPRLYKDCLVSDIGRFIRDLDSSPTKSALLDRVKTLRVIQLKNVCQPTYRTLLSSDPGRVWEAIGNCSYLPLGIKATAASWVDRATAHHSQTGFAAIELIKLRHQGLNTFPRLKRVTMSESGDQSWGSHSSDYDLVHRLEPSWLGFTLLDLPSVEHYCQSTIYGPLALTSAWYKPRYPPKTVSFHPIETLEFLDSTRPSIIFGATNRYMCPHHHRIFGSNDDLDLLLEMGELDRILDPIINIVTAYDTVRVMKSNCDGADMAGVAFASVSVIDTTLELYNYVRRLPLAFEEYPSSLDAHTWPLPESDLAPIQAILDSWLAHGRWKGRVILKNAEDCEPCSACGQKGYWADPGRWRKHTSSTIHMSSI